MLLVLLLLGADDENIEDIEEFSGVWCAWGCQGGNNGLFILFVILFPNPNKGSFVIDSKTWRTKKNHY
jgi:hypothetical protein